MTARVQGGSIGPTKLLSPANYVVRRMHFRTCARSCEVRVIPMSRHHQTAPVGPKRAKRRNGIASIDERGRQLRRSQCTMKAPVSITAISSVPPKIAMPRLTRAGIEYESKWGCSIMPRSLVSGRGARTLSVTGGRRYRAVMAQGWNKPTFQGWSILTTLEKKLTIWAQLPRPGRQGAGLQNPRT